ncbi:MAG: TFIIB-type zinc ribbon-containing protein [Clostridia bacterium]|nr:TFIIB-type zinc ribbon-containing protein [Clostridia bacterium]
MSVFAGICPCCGKDIGFDPGSSEYTCVHCGAVLKTAALKGERVGVPADGSSGANHEDQPDDEQITRELIRKAGFKTELKKAEKELGDLRARRPAFEKRLKALRSLTAIGIVLAAAAAAVVAIFADSSGDGPDTSLIAAGVIAAAGVFMLILAEVRRREIKKDRAKLEDTILIKKQERDILIGRLNKINKKLHIHHGDK